MKHKLSFLLAVAAGMTLATGCIDEIEPQSSYATVDQVSEAPGVFDKYVNTVTMDIIGKTMYDGNPYDFGYPSCLIQHDIMGQDMVCTDGSWFSYWYTCSIGLGPQYAICQIPWTYYYVWINNCNTVLKLAGENPPAEQIHGAGIAHAMRAMFYMDLAQLFAQKTYGIDKTAETVPFIGSETSVAEMTNNPRATNEVMWGTHIMGDLDKAEEYLKDYVRTDVYTPDLSVVYGMKARAYLIMQDWPNAEKYAKLAMEGYSVLDKSEYTSRTNGFNTPNHAWMFGMTYKPNDPNILDNDGDTSFGSQMCMEVNPDESVSGMGYASNYGYVVNIMDRHLYETIPPTDFRKDCFVDPAIDDMADADKLTALEKYTYYPDRILHTASKTSYKKVGGLSLKYRLKGGETDNQYKGFCIAIPLMRVEEMKLIEAEAAGMQDEGRGKTLLTAFAKTRDTNYEYGKHNEAYGSASIATAFQNEIWWQRRVEFWGEGLSTYDIKRYNKGIIRSYAGTNHQEGYRWNSETTPDWMNLCIVQTETNYNRACTNNPAPVKDMGDDPEHVW